jgi:outer membrane protein assembly factor BamB
LANMQVSNPCPPNCAGTLYAYDATTLDLLWCTNSLKYSATNCDNSTTFVPATFARPTIVNGNIYVPTYGGITKAGNPKCTTAAPCSGVIVYVHNP